MILVSGTYYWMRQKFENIWRPVYVFEDADENQWLQGICIPAIRVSKMDLNFFDFVNLILPDKE